MRRFAFFALTLLMATSISAPLGAWAETYTVSIPNGAANPTIDLTLQNVGKWYEPGELTVKQGDTVT